MLYVYKDKVYVKPFANKLVEVKIEKEKDGTYNVLATPNVVVDDYIDSKIVSISTEQAYEFLSKKKKKISRED